MKLYEFSALAHVNIVVAAESREAAEKELEAISAEGWVSIGDVSDVSDIELFDERELKSSDPFDEAHIA